MWAQEWLSVGPRTSIVLDSWAYEATKRICLEGPGPKGVADPCTIEQDHHHRDVESSWDVKLEWLKIGSRPRLIYEQASKHACRWTHHCTNSGTRSLYAYQANNHHWTRAREMSAWNGLLRDGFTVYFTPPKKALNEGKKGFYDEFHLNMLSLKGTSQVICILMISWIWKYENPFGSLACARVWIYMNVLKLGHKLKQCCLWPPTVRGIDLFELGYSKMRVLKNHSQPTPGESWTNCAINVDEWTFVCGWVGLIPENSRFPLPPCPLCTSLVLKYKYYTTTKLSKLTVDFWQCSTRSWLSYQIVAKLVNGLIHVHSLSS